ncbi:efflux RND transporter periplasmic adaptor subunit [Kineosporia succinea]|uniref:HlyD family secretion protein n=1 Tax=Kineosporia succinea TaxID=84632 RepID=A0ABT9PCT6_9ACTN|nr:hypothetical protein [Kineosporia succinea]MDP9830297.1 hypothetical protein [Kineosporia succinea]
MSDELPRPRLRRPLTVTAAVASVALVGSGVYLITRPEEAGAARPAAAALEKVTVTRTDLDDHQLLPGTLGYGRPRAVKGTRTGSVTQIVRAGKTLERGDQLARVDDQPMIVFYGQTPLFRDLDRRGLVGRDVKVVADNLLALGYGIGEQPAVGSLIQAPDESAPTPPGDPDLARTDTQEPDPQPTPAATTASRRHVRVQAGDGVLTPALLLAIGRWREDVGLDDTGTDGLRMGDVVVLSGPVRVDTATAALGDAGDGPLVTVTSREKTVLVQVDSARISSVRVGQKVRVALPDQRRVRATVRGISRTVEDQPEDQGESVPKQDVTITVDKTAALKHLDAASVTVEFTTGTAKDVLAVPVGSLLALAGGGYALQPPQGALIPVETGMFADGLVEVEGDGVREGLEVVTTR